MNPSYNSFRFFAFFAVFLFHTERLLSGYLGVQAFFVLSGFLITPILVETKAETRSFGSYIKNFLVRRTLRIFPLYYFYLLLLLLAILVFGLSRFEYFDSLRGQLIYGFTYTYNIYHSTVYFEHNKFISHFWSLAVEEQFYLLWPLLIYFTRAGKLKTVLQAIIVLGPVIRLLLGYFILHTDVPHLAHNREDFIYLTTFSHLDAFAIGGYFALYQTRAVGNREMGGTLAAVVLLGCLTNYLANGSLQLPTFGFPPYMENSGKYIWGYTLVNYCFALLLYKLKTRRFNTWLFENKVLVSLGKVSYGLYVYHYGMIYLAHLAGDRWGLMQHPLTRLLVDGAALLATIGVSYLSFYCLENKFIRLKDRIAPKHVPPAPAAAAEVVVVPVESKGPAHP